MGRLGNIVDFGITLWQNFEIDNLLIHQLYPVLAVVIGICVLVMLFYSLDRKTDMISYVSGAFATYLIQFSHKHFEFIRFDWTSDVGFCLALYVNDKLIYFYLLLGVVLVSTFKSIALFIWRIRSVMKEHYTAYWKNEMPGGFVILPILFVLSGFSPLYYDLITTSTIDFPLHPKFMSTIPREKLSHLVMENVFSISITFLYIYKEGGETMAFVSILFSSLMTFILLMAGTLDAMYASESSSEASAVEIEVLVTYPTANVQASKTALNSYLQKRMGSHFEVRVWWLRHTQKEVTAHVICRRIDQVSSKAAMTLSEDQIETRIGHECHKFFEGKSGMTYREGHQRRSISLRMKSQIWDESDLKETTEGYGGASFNDEDSAEINEGFTTVQLKHGSPTPGEGSIVLGSHVHATYRNGVYPGIVWSIEGNVFKIIILDSPEAEAQGLEGVIVNVEGHAVSHQPRQSLSRKRKPERKQRMIEMGTIGMGTIIPE